MPEPVRVLVVGSTNWDHRLAIEHWLDYAVSTFRGREVVLVHRGNEEGPDSVIEEWAAQRSVPTEAHPVTAIDRKVLGQGVEQWRDRSLVGSGGFGLCVCFVRGDSRDELWVTRAAHDVGIPTWIVRYPDEGVAS